jgi:hypothetical protein
MSGLTLDTGALIAFERADRRAVALVRKAIERDLDIAVPAGALAQAWRGGPRQARLAALLGYELVVIEALDAPSARLAGELCGRSNTADVVGASVVVCARRRRHTVVTSDPDDLRRLDSGLQLETV